MHHIFHITRQDHWEQARSAGEYRGDTLATEGFIHCSTAAQVLRVANSFYLGQRDLVLLWIDADLLDADLRYEQSEVDQEFPHIYGPLNVAAVLRVLPFPPDDDGRFTLPAAITLRSGSDHAK